MSNGLTTAECAARLCQGYAAILGGDPADYADVFTLEYVRCEIRARRLVAISARQRAWNRVLLPDFYAYLRTYHTRLSVPASPLERRSA